MTMNYGRRYSGVSAVSAVPYTRIATPVRLCLRFCHSEILIVYYTPAGGERLMFLPSTFFFSFVLYWLVLDRTRHFEGLNQPIKKERYLVIAELGMHGPPAGGCRANNVNNNSN